MPIFMSSSSGWQPAKLQVKELLSRFAVGWREQRAEMFDLN
jgi:hypothetical protein